MFDSQPLTAASLIAQVRQLGDALAAFGGVGDPGVGDSGADLVALLAELEQLKCRAEGAQVAASVAFDVGQRAEQAAAGMPPARQGQGVGLQVALARRESHHRGARHLGLARTLTRELPRTLRALREGRISEWRATLVARETACLSRDDRARVEQELTDQLLTETGEGELVGELRRLSYRLDPESVVARRRRAESERCVSLRPAPDCMTYLTALLPVADGVGAFAALTKTADTARADGERGSDGQPRSRGQVMADLLVTRILGQDDGQRPSVPVTINVVVSDELLFGDGEGSGDVDGYGPVPAAVARELASAPQEAQVAVRRLYARPGSGSLVAMDSTSRCFPAGLATLIRLRDRICRTPWCDAPVRHIDHVQPAAEGGATTLDNGQGLCEACNYAKQAPGWEQETTAGPRHSVVTTTPTGVLYRSTAPPCLHAA